MLRGGILAALAIAAASLSVGTADAAAQDAPGCTLRGSVCAPVLTADCTKRASPGAGTGGDGAFFPYGSVRELVASLRPGETGCLGPGEFEENVDLSGISGQPGAPIRITSERTAQPATIRGVVGSDRPQTLHFGADTSYVEVSGLAIHGRRSASPGPAVVVNGRGNALVGNEITNAGVTTCVQVGPSAAQRASDIVLDGNAIHACGGGDGDPRAAGIALGYTNAVTIAHGYVYGNPAQGVVLYPDADGTTIANNVVDGHANGMGDGAGIQLAGDSGAASDNTTIANNIVSGSESYNIAHNWEGPVGAGNTVRDNCLFGARPDGNYQPPPTGYTAAGNVENSDPLYQNPGAPPGGYGLSPGSPCAGKGPLPAVATTEGFEGATEIVDPTEESVFSARLTGLVNSRFQAASFGFDFGPGDALQPFGGDAVTPNSVPRPVELDVENLEPSTDYAYRLVASNGSGSSSGEVLRFRTSAPPPLAPPALAVSYSHRPKRGGRVLSNIKASAGGSGGVVSCKGRGCPFKGSRGLRAARRLAARVLKPGVRIVFTTRFGTRTTLYQRQIALSVRKRGRSARLARSESCSEILSRGRPDRRRRRRIQCVSLTRRITLHPTRPRFKLLRVLNLPIGTTVDIDCRGRGCPRTPRCWITEAGTHPELSLLGRSRAARTARIGTTFTIRVMKPRTRGLVTRIALKRGNRVQSRVVQSTGYLSARTRVPRGCADL